MPAISYHRIRLQVEDWCGEDYKGEGQLLPTMLELAVPLWMQEFRDAGSDYRQQELRRLLDEPDFTQRLEYVLHKGPKKGDSAKAFNSLAKLIALLSFFPGGIRCFGRRYQWENSKGESR